jgi:glycosyltransferase involved in cell wall biosynthesis
MRILHFLRSARHDIGGPARAVVDLCAALAKRGHEVNLATIDGADLPEGWTARGDSLPQLVKVQKPALGGRWYIRAASTQLAKLVQTHDVLHVHGMWDSLNVQLCRLAASRGIPYVISIRGMLGDWSMDQSRTKKRLYLGLLGSRWLRESHGIHLTAQAEFDQARAWFPPELGIVIPNLLDLEPFISLPGAESAMRAFSTPRGTPRLLFLSRIHPKKGVEVLLRALRILKDQGIAVCCLIAGSGDVDYVASLRALAVSLGLSMEECHFIGPITGSLKLSLYQSADVFVLPTNQENFGFVFIEALASGLPVVTTRGVDIWPELESSGAAKIAHGNPESIADSLRGMLASPEKLGEMRQRGREWVFRTMDPARIVERFEAFYEKRPAIARR